MRRHPNGFVPDSLHALRRYSFKQRQVLPTLSALRPPRLAGPAAGRLVSSGDSSRPPRAG